MKSKLLVQLAVFSLFISCGKHINTTSLGKSSEVLEDTSIEILDTSGPAVENENDIEVLNVETGSKFLNHNFDDNDQTMKEENQIDLSSLLKEIPLSELEYVVDGESTEKFESDELFKIDEEKGLCITTRLDNGRLSFDCAPVDLDSLIKINRPCVYKDRVYLHGSIIPVHPGNYRITPGGSVITLVPGSFLVCIDGRLVPKTLPQAIY